MKKILISGEGVTDCGEKEYGTDKWIEGPVQVYIKKVMGNDIEIINIEKKEILRANRSKKESKSKLRGHGLKAYRLCLVAENRQANHVMCYVDSDSTEIKDFNEIYNDIIHAYSKLDREEDSIPIIPVTMIESWILADEEAYYLTFGKYPEKVKLPKKPESIWGNEDEPKSDYPKRYLERVLEQFDKKSCREIFCEIAENSDIETLRKKCPLSFGRFYEDLIKLK